MSDLVVHIIPSAWGLPSIGPFCLKLEAWLRMMDVPYTNVVDATPFRGPKGKLPWIEHDGNKLGDSGFIIDYLERRLGRSPDDGLTAEERAVSNAFRRMLEENFYWTLVYDRWMVDENWPLTKTTVLGSIPAPARAVIAPVARRGVAKQLAAHGIGRHSRDEIHAIGRRDIGAVADFLGDKPYMLGDRPRSIDAVAYGILANVLMVPVESPVKQEGLARENLVRYLDRIRTRYFS
jgi:glutathione S-transferase